MDVLVDHVVDHVVAVAALMRSESLLKFGCPRLIMMMKSHPGDTVGVVG